jgi:hypothetical protein
MKKVVKIFNYIEPMWLGKNKEVSIRRVLALCFSLDFLRNMSHIIHKWDSGKSLSEATMLLGLEVGLIVSLLALTTYTSSLPINNTNSNTE